MITIVVKGLQIALLMIAVSPVNVILRPINVLEKIFAILMIKLAHPQRIVMMEINVPLKNV